MGRFAPNSRHFFTLPPSMDFSIFAIIRPSQAFAKPFTECVDDKVQDYVSKNCR